MESVTAALAGIFIPALIFLLILQYFRNGRKTGRTVLPGPRFALPKIGHLHLLGPKPHRTFQKWKKEYGSLYMFKMAGQNMYVINDAKLMREFFSLSVANGRPHNAYWKAYTRNHGIVNSDGRNWEEQRAFAVKTLGELGLSKSGNLQGIICDEAQSLVQYFEKRAGLPIRANKIFNGAVISSLWSIMSGEKVEWMVDGELNEVEFLKLAGGIQQGINQGIKSGLAILPWLRFFPGWKPIWNKWLSTIDRFLGRVELTVQNHMQALDSNAPRDLIDHFLIRIQAMSKPTSSFYKETGRFNCLATVGDLFFAGSVTTSTILEYTMMFLGSHPDAQNKLHQELDKVLGLRCPTLSDRNGLPYTQATILEVIRRSAAVSSSLRRLTEETTLRGHTLSKDSIILTDYFSILRDSEEWSEDVEEFRPERFLNEDETELVINEAFIPFAVGRRACIGELLAKDTLFLFLTSIFQKFRVEVVGDVDFDSVEAGFTLEPHPFEIRVSLRS